MAKESQSKKTSNRDKCNMLNLLLYQNYVYFAENNVSNTWVNKCLLTIINRWI